VDIARARRARPGAAADRARLQGPAPRPGDVLAGRGGARGGAGVGRRGGFPGPVRTVRGRGLRAAARPRRRDARAPRHQGRAAVSERRQPRPAGCAAGAGRRAPGLPGPDRPVRRGPARPGPPAGGGLRAAHPRGRLLAGRSRARPAHGRGDPGDRGGPGRTGRALPAGDDPPDRAGAVPGPGPAAGPGRGPGRRGRGADHRAADLGRPGSGGRTGPPGPGQVPGLGPGPAGHGSGHDLRAGEEKHVEKPEEGRPSPRDGRPSKPVLRLWTSCRGPAGSRSAPAPGSGSTARRGPVPEHRRRRT